jgi:hypothetical protein
MMLRKKKMDLTDVPSNTAERDLTLEKRVLKKKRKEISNNRSSIQYTLDYSRFWNKSLRDFWDGNDETGAETSSKQRCKTMRKEDHRHGG